MEFWTEIEPHILEIITAIGMIVAITKTRYKKSVIEKAKEDLEKQRKKTQKDKKTLENDLKREAELEEKIKNE